MSRKERLGITGRDQLCSVAENRDHWRQLINLLHRDPKGLKDDENK